MIELSKAAAGEIKRLQSKRQNHKARFRLGVKPGGCLGMSYVLTFDEALNSDDQLYDCNGIQVVVDAQSSNYLHGFTLDYSEDLMGGGFRFHNPNAKDNCGCGNSFSTYDSLPEGPSAEVPL